MPSAVAEGYTEKMKHTDLITDKKAGWVGSSGDGYYFADALMMMLYNASTKIQNNQF